MFFIADLSAVILHPLHEGIPSLVLHINCTCNRFRQHHCRSKYEKLKAMLVEEGFETAVGHLCGRSSDGDSKRRADQIASMSVLLRFIGHACCWPMCFLSALRPVDRLLCRGCKAWTLLRRLSCIICVLNGVLPAVAFAV